MSAPLLDVLAQLPDLSLCQLLRFAAQHFAQVQQVGLAALKQDVNELLVFQFFGNARVFELPLALAPLDV